MLSSFFSSFLLAIPIFSPRPNVREYNIVNKCPTAINLYIGGVLEGNIASGGSVTKFLSTAAGFFYTDANGGNPDGAGTTRAGFFGDDLYYIVEDPAHMNTGLQVRPRYRSSNSAFCPTIECDDLSCSQGFSQPPTRFPNSGASPPTPPYFRCPVDDTIFDITFCPTGILPPQPAALHPNGNAKKCLDVKGGVFADGTPVQIFDCNQTPAQQWVIQRGFTRVRVGGQNFCLDAGSNPGNGIGLKIWTCFGGLPAQEWFYTDDDRIALNNQGFCVDLTGGILTNGNKVQEWKCADFDANQIWTQASLFD